MRTGVTHLLGLLASLLLIGGGGCDKSTKPIVLNPQESGKKALELYDSNSDGKLDAKELQSSPSLLWAGRRVDQNGDGAITADEIAARLEAYKGQSSFIGCAAFVTWQRRPLAGAEVVFEPEPFMGEGLQVYRGTTDDSGMANLDSEVMTPGLPVGFYRVSVSKKENGAEILPDKFNTNSILGWEMADDNGNPSRANLDLRP